MDNSDRRNRRGIRMLQRDEPLVTYLKGSVPAVDGNLIAILSYVIRRLRHRISLNLHSEGNADRLHRHLMSILLQAIKGLLNSRRLYAHL